MTKTPVVVLNMHYSGLGIARSLGPHGVPVHGLSSTEEFPGNYSRYCQFQLSPDSLKEPVQLREFLLKFAGTLKGPKPLLLPTRDHDIHFLMTHREALERAFVIPMASREILEQALNKDRCLEIAQGCGIPVPASHTISRGDELRAIVEQLTFPVIIKPLYARQWRQPGIWETVGHQKAAIIESRQDLIDFYASIEAAAPLASVQEYIPGPDSSLVIFGSFCRPGGEVRAFFTGRKRLQDPPLKGTGLIVEGTPIPEIVPHSKTLLRALQFEGISEIEFKIHEQTGVPYLIEINPRHWDQHYLGTACGVNLSLELYRDFTESERLSRNDDPAPTQRHDPVRWVAEQDLLFYALRGLRTRRPGLWDELRMNTGNRTYSVMNPDDPAPGRKQFSNGLRQIARLLKISG